MTSPASAQRGDALVMFGLTGDLGEQMLFPALVELAAAGLLDLPVIGVGRREHTADQLRGQLRDAADGKSDELITSVELDFVTGDATDPAVFDELADRLAGFERPVLYLALPPDLFGDVAACVAESRLPATARLVVEKPFGRDAVHARRLFDTMAGRLDADRLFLVDHFLAKPAVENLMTFRCANPVVDALLHRDRVDRVEITMAEDFGVTGRGSFYDGVGAIADVVQNHLLQLVAVLAMEPPADDSTDAFDAARADLLAAVAPIDPADVVLGQYGGYTDHDGVAADSTVETFVAARLSVATDRWRDVPFLIRTGKRLAGTWTEAVVVFAGDGPVPNRLRFRIKPDAAIELELGVLDTSGGHDGDDNDDGDDGDDGDEVNDGHDGHDGHAVRATTMVACGPGDHGPLGDYATMLAGALAGDRRHFAGIADVEAAWRVVDRVRAAGLTPERYEPGSMGPAAADRLAAPTGWVAAGGAATDGTG